MIDSTLTRLLSEVRDKHAKFKGSTQNSKLKTQNSKLKTQTCRASEELRSLVGGGIAQQAPAETKGLIEGASSLPGIVAVWLSQ